MTKKRKYFTIILDDEETYEEFKKRMIEDEDFKKHPGCYYHETEHGIRITLSNEIVEIETNENE